MKKKPLSITIASNYIFNNELQSSLLIVNHIRSLILLTLCLQDGLYFLSQFPRAVPEVDLQELVETFFVL